MAHYTIKDKVRVISDRLTNSDIMISFQSNEAINQTSLTLTRAQMEQMIKEIVAKMPHSERFVNSLVELVNGKTY